MIRAKNILIPMLAAISLSACKKDVDPVFIIPPSTGAQLQLNGIAGAESGTVAANSVYIDLSGARQTPVLRNGWDLGFYSGNEFRVIINNFAIAGAKVLAKNNLNDVTGADTIGLSLTTSQFNPLPEQLAYFDDINGDLSKTVIPAVSAIDAENKVIILNRGTGGGIAARPWVKLRVLRNTAGGYTLQYAGIQQNSFITVQVGKDAAYHFNFFNFEQGVVSAQPEKDKWDLVWSYSLFQANFGAGLSPYNFSDMIATNHLSGVGVAAKVYANAATANAAYTNFNRDSVTQIQSFSTSRWSIGSSWRSTQPATGARLDRFYIIKDPAGNHYKFRCQEMGVNDGGTRGKPKFTYELIK